MSALNNIITYHLTNVSFVPFIFLTIQSDQLNKNKHNHTLISRKLVLKTKLVLNAITSLLQLQSIVWFIQRNLDFF